jgi:hypothetical protein
VAVATRADTCFATQTTGRSGRMTTPSPSRIRVVAPAAAASETTLSMNGAPVPATSWSTTHADSRPRSSACRAEATMSPGWSLGPLMLGRKTPMSGAGVAGMRPVCRRRPGADTVVTLSPFTGRRLR